MVAYKEMTLSAILALSLLPVLSIAHQKRVVDMTYAQSGNSVYWPTYPDFKFTILNREQHPDYWFEANFVEQPEHIGTHMDAPAHLAKGFWRVHQIPIDRLMGPGVVVNVKDKATDNADYRLSVQDLLDWEAKYGRIPSGAVVLMNSGWGYRYPNRSDVFLTSNLSDPSTFHFPGIHVNAAKWLTKERFIHLIGVDTPSLDYGRSTTFPSHITFFESNIPGLESVANVDLIPEDGSAMVYAAVHKLFDGSGGPVRVFAVFEEGDPGTSHAERIYRNLALHAISVVLLIVA